jgi:hypothetical protein
VVALGTCRQIIPRAAPLALDLAPGTYIALCFVPDEETGVPHALMGMVQVFTVGEGMATPAA